MLGRKQSVRNNEDWKNALDHIEETVSKKELDSLVKKTVKDIKEKCKGKKAAYAWSAGKDSLVLGEICEKAGIDQSVLVRCNLEYPAFIAWIEQNKPSGLEVINTGQDMEWLKKHPDMLFPDKSNKAAQWFHIVQHRGQARYYKEHQLEILLLGRRKADGNYVGKDNAFYRKVGYENEENEMDAGRSCTYLGVKWMWRYGRNTDCRRLYKQQYISRNRFFCYGAVRSQSD